MTVAKVRTISAVLVILLASWDIAWCGSKYAFPGLDESDLPFYLDKQEQTFGHNIYLYSSLSLLSLQKTSITFDISRHPSKHVNALITMDFFPEIDFRIRSEFFDFTIWGQLGNFFNSDIEIVKLEAEIVAVLQEIEKVNKRYKNFVDAGLILKMQTDKVITIDRGNFIDSNRERNKGKSSEENDESLHSKSDNSKAGLNSTIQMYERKSQHERLQAAIHARTAKAGTLEPGFSQAAYVTPGDAPQKGPGAGSDVDSLFFRLFQRTMTLLKYFKENRIESLIYLSFLLLLGAFIKVLVAK